MLLQTWMQICFSGMDGGGVHGKAAGIAHSIMTEAGGIITVSQVSILMLTRVGEGTTGDIIGMDTGGTIKGSLTITFTRTGDHGTMTSVGEGREPGVSRTINLGHPCKGRK